MIKINDFRGELTDVSAIKEALDTVARVNSPGTDTISRYERNNGESVPN